MFRKLNSIPMTPCGLVTERRLVPVGDSGMFEEKVFDLEKVKLPDAKLYDLKTLVKNHVPLERVNSLILDSGAIDPRVASALSEISTETSTETSTAEV